MRNFVVVAEIAGLVEIFNRYAKAPDLLAQISSMDQKVWQV
jgi:hypothetical protein